MGKEMQVLFLDKIKGQSEQNQKRYGEQTPEKLLLVAQAQLGHISEQFYKNGACEKFRIEIIHLAAVLYDLYGK
jgi:hypothetical protein